MRGTSSKQIEFMVKPSRITSPRTLANHLRHIIKNQTTDFVNLITRSNSHSKTRKNIIRNQIKTSTTLLRKQNVMSIITTLYDDHLQNFSPTKHLLNA